MPILLGTDPTKAFKEIGRLDTAINALIKKHGGTPRSRKTSTTPGGTKVRAAFTGRIQSKLASAIERTTRGLAGELQSETPRWSYWLRANWNHQQGSFPTLGITPSPKRKKGLYRDFVQPIIGGVSLDGTRPQYFYNNVEYAAKVAAGNFNPSEASRADWFLSIQQFHISGRYLLNSIQRA